MFITKTQIMKTPILLLLVLLFSTNLKAQYSSDCDSLFIECCTYNTVNPNTITFQVSNHSDDIFSYPGFILFNMQHDTIAVETVNYFGIGYFYQPHTLDIIGTLDLPFDGYLELHTDFFSDFACRLPFYAADSLATGIMEQNQISVNLFPNPATDFVRINSEHIINSVQLIDMHGQILLSENPDSNQTKINTEKINSGLYLFRINTSKGIRTKRVSIQ